MVIGYRSEPECLHGELQCTSKFWALITNPNGVGSASME